MQKTLYETDGKGRRNLDTFVAKHFELDYNRMADRYDRKRDLFEYWHNGGKETAIPVARLEGEND